MAGQQWSWANDAGGWTPYSPEASCIIEAAFADASVASVGLCLARGTSHPSHTVDLSQLLQVNRRTQFSRAVRREQPPAGTPQGVPWSWQDERQQWNAYEQWASGLLHAAYSAGRSGATLHVKKWSYWVDFNRAMQVNVATGTERPISRMDHGAADRNGLLSLPVDGLPAMPWSIDFRALTNDAADLAAVTGWRVLSVGEWEAGSTDPIMMSELGEDGEQVVRMPCHSTAMPCTFNMSTLVSAFESKSACPLCGTAYDLPGPQPTGKMSARLRNDDCDGHAGCGTIEIQYDFPNGTQVPTPIPTPTPMPSTESKP